MRPRDNASASSDVAIPSTPSASQPISGIPLDAVSKHQRVALMIYPVKFVGNVGDGWFAATEKSDYIQAIGLSGAKFQQNCGPVYSHLDPIYT